MRRHNQPGDPLAPAQEQAFHYIRKRISAGMPPTIREIMYHFGWKSTNAARSCLNALEQKGYIERSAGLARSIRLTQRGKRYV